jgi:ATP/maltotriose-dependent transcriptional regulator MalT
MPDGCNREPNGGAAFSFWDSQTVVSLQGIQQGLAQAWRLMLASQVDQALAVLEPIERQLDNLSPSVATRYRAVSYLVRSAVVVFQDDGLAVLAIVISKVLVEGGAGLGAQLTEAHGRTAAFESVARSSGNGFGQSAFDGDAITPRERDVLSMISHGNSNKQIARTLKISPETVKSHVKRIFSKLSVTTRTEAVSRAVLQRLM